MIPKYQTLYRPVAVRDFLDFSRMYSYGGALHRFAKSFSYKKSIIWKQLKKFRL